MSANGLTLSNLQAIALFELLEDGTSIRRASRELGLPYVPLLLWLETNPAFMQALNADYALMVEALQSARRLVEADHPTMTKFVLERMDPSKWMPQTDTPQADATAIGNNLKSVINIVNQAPRQNAYPPNPLPAPSAVRFAPRGRRVYGDWCSTSERFTDLTRRLNYQKRSRDA